MSAFPNDSQADCPSCGESIRWVWPRDDDETVTLRCRWCEATVWFDRELDGTVVEG